MKRRSLEVMLLALLLTGLIILPVHTTSARENEEKNSVDDVEYGYEMDCEDGNLNADEKSLVHILREEKSLASNALYGYYSQRTKYPKGERSFRNYMRNRTASYVPIVASLFLFLKSVLVTSWAINLPVNFRVMISPFEKRVLIVG